MSTVTRIDGHRRALRPTHRALPEDDLPRPSLPPPPVFVASVCPDCGAEVMALVERDRPHQARAPHILVEREEVIGLITRSEHCGQMRHVRLAHRPRCPGRPA